MFFDNANAKLKQSWETGYFLKIDGSSKNTR